jgi:endonuclease YncB( thermonuclease family)
MAMIYHYLLPLLGLFLGREIFTIHPPSQWVTVEKVLDGDTVILKGQGALRLAGIDAPERGQLTRLKGIDAGEWSKACLKRLLEGKRLRVVVQGRDRYGRQLGDLIHAGSVALQMMESGCVSIYPISTTRELVRAYERAKRARVGLWGYGGFERPYHYRRRHKKGPPKWAFRPGRKSGS